MDNCLRCESYKNCTRTHGWFYYGEIRYCPYQVIWIIENSETLLIGDWPDNPDGSSYIDPQVKTGYKSEAYYTKPVGILAEVNKRLARAGTSGKLLRAEVIAGIELSDESRDALMFVKGKRRKRMGFSAWRKSRSYRRKNEALLSR